MKISVALIVKNEADHIETVLSSVKGADEIIVCDTGSEDNTVELAKKFTDKVYTDYKWNDDFAEARNHALSKCSGDWVLSIDADEYLEEGGMEKIRTLISEAKEQKTFAVKMKGGSNVHYLPRIFRNDGSVKWVGRGHEVLSPREDNRVDIQITYGYSTAHLKDPDRMLRILTKQVEENPNSPREKYYLAREYYYRKNWDKAIEIFTQYVMISQWPAEKADAYLYLARCYFIKQQGDLARESCLRAIQLNPDFKEALYFMAELHFEPWKNKWLKIAEQATNQDVLFVRDLPMKKEVKPLDMSEMDIMFFKNVLVSFKNPKVLEWGSGYSTAYFSQFCKCDWTSVEHHSGWAKTVKGWNLPNVTVIEAEQNSDRYFNIEDKFDIIFIDGRNRRKCLIKAKELLNEGGIVLLHDADREYYHSGFEGYHWKFVNHKFNNEPRLWVGTLRPFNQKIPKIIHQIWIGNKERPVDLMNTWRLEGWDYKLWTEKEIDELGLQNRDLYDRYYSEGCFNGCANVARVEILEKFGGIYIDADSICKHTLEGAPFLDWDIFSVYEADNFYIDGIRLVANGIIGAIPSHPLIVKYKEELSKVKEINPSWRMTGPLLWSKVMKQNWSILPSYTFLPEHHTGKKNEVKGVIYSQQYWGTTKNIYASK